MKRMKIDAGKLVKYWLDKQGMSQSELGRSMGVTRGLVNKMLGRDSFTTQTLTRLASIFKVSPSEFIKPAENNYK